MIFYAKSTPAFPHTETIQQHTEALLACYDQLKKSYQSKFTLMSERDWQLLYWAVKYHDVGKYDAVFQNKILKAIKQPSIPIVVNESARHNYVSVLAIPDEKLDLDQDELSILIQAVGYHHEGAEPPEHAILKEVYIYHILPHREQIESELGIELNLNLNDLTDNLVDLKHANRIRESNKALFSRYVLIKGLLHRLDHAASAHVSVELAVDMVVGDCVNQFILKAFEKGKNDLQLFAEENQDKHVVAIAQTGMGKTEAGLLWLGKDKGFLTLPLRVSINAMYERIIDPKKIGFTRKTEGTEHIEEATGLLHSTSIDHLHGLMEANDESLEKIYAQCSQFANKLIISTIDQILKFPFFYLGFEKEYATLASSKIIIDELQAYNPEIAALIVRALVMIDQIGGSFMIMTATLPDFYYKALSRKMSKSRLPIVYDQFIEDKVVRHHVELKEQSILDEATQLKIVQEGEQYKVLVICNTVKRAQKVYQLLCEQLHASNHKKINVYLLHARFIKKDRAQLEKKIIQFAETAGVHGIWVTTQLVEASLDIDFDRLHTEMSSLDSQFQRYGRCNRKGEKLISEVNVSVYTTDVSGIGFGKKSVYHDDIYQRSLMLFQNYKTHVLLESEKQEMINQLYDEQQLEGSDFKKLFDDTLKQLENRPMYETTKKEAQDLLRNIDEVQAIPDCYRGNIEIEQALDDWRFAKGASEEVRRQKRKARQILEQYTVSVNRGMAEGNHLLTPLAKDINIQGLHYINMKYDEQMGLDTSYISAHSGLFIE